MSNYALILHGDPNRFTKYSPEEMQEISDKYMAWGKDAEDAGFLRASHRLALDPGKVMRANKITDGPYSETKEILGGIYIIQAASYDEALNRIQGHPQVEYGGAIEVRALHVMECHDE